MGLAIIKHAIKNAFSDAQIALLFTAPSGLLLKIVEIEQSVFTVYEYDEDDKEWYATHTGTGQEIVDYIND